MNEDTPRTNRVTFYADEAVNRTAECVHATFARELERENARLRARYLDLLGQVEQAREGFGIYHDSPSMASAIEMARALLLANA